MDWIIITEAMLIIAAAFHIPAAAKHEKPGVRSFAGIALLLYCTVVALLTLQPLQLGGGIFQPVPFKTISNMLADCLQNGIINRQAAEAWTGSPVALLTEVLSYSARNLFANLFLFVPIGVLAALHIKRAGWGAAALGSLAVPVFIELWQLLLTTSRTCDIDDVILNFAGVFAGYAAVTLIRRIIFRERRLSHTKAK